MNDLKTIEDTVRSFLHLETKRTMPADGYLKDVSQAQKQAVLRQLQRHYDTTPFTHQQVQGLDSVHGIALRIKAKLNAARRMDSKTYHGGFCVRTNLEQFMARSAVA